MTSETLIPDQWLAILLVCLSECMGHTPIKSHYLKFKLNWQSCIFLGNPIAMTDSRVAPWKTAHNKIKTNRNQPGNRSRRWLHWQVPLEHLIWGGWRKRECNRQMRTSNKWRLHSAQRRKSKLHITMSKFENLSEPKNVNIFIVFVNVLFMLWENLPVASIAFFCRGEDLNME